MGNIIAWFMKLIGGAAIQKIIKSIPAIVVEVEKAMADKKITEDERKGLAMKFIDAIAEQFNITISGILRWGISMLIDKISAKLPSKDIVIPDIVLRVTGKF